MGCVHTLLPLYVYATGQKVKVQGHGGIKCVGNINLNADTYVRFLTSSIEFRVSRLFYIRRS